MNDENVKTLSIPDAGRIYFGLGKNGSYEAAKRGEIPTIKIGRRKRAPVAVLEHMVGIGAAAADVATHKPRAD